MNKKQKKTLERILIAVALVIVLKLLPALPMPVELALYCIPYLVVGWDVLRKALKGIKNRQPFDECYYEERLIFHSATCRPIHTFRPLLVCLYGAPRIIGRGVYI